MSEERREKATERLLLARTARTKLEQRQAYARFPDETAALRRLDDLIATTEALLAALRSPTRGFTNPVDVQTKAKRRADDWKLLSQTIAEIDGELAALGYLNHQSREEEAMSLLHTVRNTLKSISGRHNTLSASGSETSIRETAKEAYKVVDDAILDPMLRLALEQSVLNLPDPQRLRFVLQSPERIAAFVEHEKSILIRLGASRQLADAIFDDLKFFPAELLDALPPSEVYQLLERLRVTLLLTIRNLGSAASGSEASKELSKTLAGALHAAFGVAVLIGNFSGVAILLFPAPMLAGATACSVWLGQTALSRAYTRLTEAGGA